MDTNNTDVRLAGGELFGEYDMGYNWVTFAAVSYVQATDRLRNEPLWASRRSIRGWASAISRKIGGWSSPPGSWTTRNGSRCDLQQRCVVARSPRVEEATPGFTVFDLRGYYSWSERVRLVAGIENIGDLDYQEHLDNRVDLRTARPAASSARHQLLRRADRDVLAVWGAMPTSA